MPDGWTETEWSLDFRVGGGELNAGRDRRGTLDLAYATLDHQLTGSHDDGWLAGDDFTLADCAAAPALHYPDVLHSLHRHARRALAAYFDRVLTRPSVARVVEEARPYRELFPLPWPERVR